MRIIKPPDDDSISVVPEPIICHRVEDIGTYISVSNRACHRDIASHLASTYTATSLAKENTTRV